jgi:hypothetical protein
LEKKIIIPSYLGVAGFLLLLFPLFYGLGLRESVVAALEGSPEPWLKSILEIFYPRYFIEKNRLPASFFVSKADQVIFRCTLLGILLASLYIITLVKQVTLSTQFLYTPSHEKTFFWLRILLTCINLLVWFELYNTVLDRTAIQSFYVPRSWFKLLGPQYPSAPMIHTLGIVWLLSMAAGLWKRWALASSILHLLFFGWFQSYYFGFEKIDHSFYTLFLIYLCYPFYCYEHRVSGEIASWSLRWMQLLIAMVYILTALEKITISGLDWLAPENLQVRLWMHETPAGNWLAQYPFLCQLSLGSTWIIQLSFVCIFTHRRLSPWVLAAGCLFHWSTFLFLNIGHWLHPWILAYVVFIVEYLPGSARHKAPNKMPEIPG